MVSYIITFFILCGLLNFMIGDIEPRKPIKPKRQSSQAESNYETSILYKKRRNNYEI